MQQTKRLIFIRHGQTDENKTNTIHAKNSVSGLNKKGKEQIIKVVGVCRENNVNFVICSPEKRARESADIIGKALGFMPLVLSDIREREWGDWEGKTWKEIEEKLNTMTLDERYTFIPPHGESWQQMEQRLENALKTILSFHEDTIAIVTHEGILRALIPLLLNMPKEKSFLYHFDNASVTIFNFSSEKYTRVIVNDTSHLR